MKDEEKTSQVKASMQLAGSVAAIMKASDISRGRSLRTTAQKRVLKRSKTSRKRRTLVLQPLFFGAYFSGVVMDMARDKDEDGGSMEGMGL